MRDEKPKRTKLSARKIRERRFRHLAEDYARIILIQNGMSGVENDARRDADLAADYAAHVIRETDERVKAETLILEKSEETPSREKIEADFAAEVEGGGPFPPVAAVPEAEEEDKKSAGEK